jgi:DNA-binding Lrp family transcriptional regulator
LTRVDDIDRRILRELDVEPRVPVALLAQRLGLARGTVAAHLAKMDREQVLRAHSTRVLPSALGKTVSGMVRAEVDQHSILEAIQALEKVPEVIECFAPAGDTDLLLRVVATDPDDMYRVSEAIRLCPGIVRTNTSVFLREVIPYRVTRLLDAARSPDNS